jgi:hypothetical protein
MSFEDLTLVPIQTKMINADLLTASEELWLDNYHKLVRRCCLIATNCNALHMLDCNAVCLSLPQRTMIVP